MKITVAVSGINTTDNPGPGTGIIRSLRESSLAKEFDLRIIGLAYDAMDAGVYMRDIIDKSYLMPYPSSGKESFLKRLEYIHNKEQISVIISALDAELPIFIDIADLLKQQYNIRMLIPNRQMFRLRDKTRIEELAHTIGVKAPKYAICSSATDFTNQIEEIGFPCMIKGPFYEAFKAACHSEAYEHFNKIINKWGYPVIVQSFICGDECNVIGCGDGSGKDCGIFGMRKMTITALGKVWNAVSIRNQRLLDAAKNMVNCLNWSGGFEIEAIISSDSQIYLIEVNPRFPAWVYMASACGINLPERMVRLLLGLPFESHSDYPSGKLMIRYTGEFLRDIADFDSITTSGEL